METPPDAFQLRRTAPDRLTVPDIPASMKSGPPRRPCGPKVRFSLVGERSKAPCDIGPLPYMAAAAMPIAPSRTISRISPRKEMTRPAIDNPRGVRKTPMSEKIRPSTQRIHPSTGTH